jgi:hypothetical protein
VGYFSTLKWKVILSYVPIYKVLENTVVQNHDSSLGGGRVVPQRTFDRVTFLLHLMLPWVETKTPGRKKSFNSQGILHNKELPSAKYQSDFEKPS